MGKIIDFLLSNSYEEYQRIQVEKELKRYLEKQNQELTPKQIEKIKEILKEK